MVYKYKILKNYDLEKKNMAYIAGISSIGMAYKMSLAPIDIADALFVEREAIKMYKKYYNYFDLLTPRMLMSISISAMSMSQNLDKYNQKVIKYSL